MNVQTEMLPNHTARLTVEVDVADLDSAKRQAAQKYAERISVPGFRKGKAPYHIIVQRVGDAALLEEAVEVLGNAVYSKALREAQLDPYAAGSLEDFKLDPSPTFVFSVPLQPTVDLKDYRDVRLPYDPQSVQDSDVDEVLRQMQEGQAVVEESQRPAAMGDRMTLDIHGVLLPEEGADADAVPAPDHDSEQLVMHEHDMPFTLALDREPLPGFRDALLGVVAGEERIFDLPYTDDDESTLAGRTVRFRAQVKKVENVTLPSLNDALAARISGDADAEAPTTLLQLRVRVREQLTRDLEDQSKGQYNAQVMDAMLDQAAFDYPDAMVHDHVEDMLASAARRMNVTVDDYLRLTNKTREQVFEEARAAAERAIRRALLLRGVLEAEGISVTDGDMQHEMDRLIAEAGDRAEAYRAMFQMPNMRERLMNDLLERALYERISDIGQGVAEAQPQQQTTES